MAIGVGLAEFKGLRCPLCQLQGALCSWISENIKKKQCVYFVESARLSDSG